MTEKWKSFLSENIYYSPQTHIFYRCFYAGLGNDDMRELPAKVNSYLHSIIDVSALNKTSGVVGACVGRYKEDDKALESECDFEEYFTELISIDVSKKQTTIG
jgi:hypothetical protein